MLIGIWPPALHTADKRAASSTAQFTQAFRRSSSDFTGSAFTKTGDLLLGAG